MIVIDSIMYKILFFFLLIIGGVSHAQKADYLVRSDQEDSKTLLEGEWYLSRQLITNSYNFNTDSNYIELNDQKGQKIVFRDDSISVFPSKSLRYYKPPVQKYAYRLQFDSIIKTTELELFLGKKKRKQKIVNTYEIVHCSGDQLILKDDQFSSSPFGESLISCYSIYARKSVDSLYQLLEGEWFSCSNSYLSLLNSKGKIVMSKKIDCEKFTNKLSLKFETWELKNYCWITEMNRVLAGANYLPIRLYPPENLIYFVDLKFQIESLSDTELILTPQFD